MICIQRTTACFCTQSDLKGDGRYDCRKDVYIIVIGVTRINIASSLTCRFCQTVSVRAATQALLISIKLGKEELGCKCLVVNIDCCRGIRQSECFGDYTTAITKHYLTRFSNGSPSIRNIERYFDDVRCRNRC